LRWRTFSGGEGVDAGALASAAGEAGCEFHAALAARGLAAFHAGGFLVHEVLLVLCEVLFGVVEGLNGKIPSVDLGGGRGIILAGLVG